MELNDQQEKVVQDALTWYHFSPQQTFEICGEAGTGKSVVLRSIVDRLKLKENEYLPMAYTGQAAIVMRLKGFKTARSIHSQLYRFEDVYIEDENGFSSFNTQFNRPTTYKRFELKSPKDISSDVKLFVIDEGYLIDENMRKNIESFGRKVLICGDDGQLPPINGNPGYFTGEGTHRLTELMRQARDSPIVYLAHRARRGLPIHCGMYGSNVLVIEDKDITPQLISLSQAIVCGTNATRDTMNDYIRYDIKGIDSDLPIYGERMICRNNNWSIERDNISLANGLIGTVVNQPSVFGYDGNTFVIDFLPDLFPTVFDNLRVDYNYYKANYHDRQALKNNKFSVGEKFEFAYANTAYLSQGAEFDTGMYIEEFLRQNTQAQLNYTGITRFKTNLIYVKKSKRFYSYLK